MESKKGSNQQDVKIGKRSNNLENDLLPLLRGPAGYNNSNQPRKRRNSYLELLPTRRAPLNWSLGRRFQPGNGNLNRRGPIPDLEPLPGKRNYYRPRRQVVPRHHFDGAVVSDAEEDEEEHEYLPTNNRSNHHGIVSVHLVENENDA